MSKFGRWREAEEGAFERWWAKHYPDPERVATSEVNYHKYTDGVRHFVLEGEYEVNTAKLVALNTWMAARHRDSPDD